MTLTVYDRLLLLNILQPLEGDILTLRVVRDFQEQIGFEGEESERLELRWEGAQVKWNREAAEDREYLIPDAARKVVAEQLTKLNGQKKLTQDHIPLYEKFVEEA